MLETLKRIVQEVNNAEDLNAALRILVARVRHSMDTEVCSVYIVDKKDDSYVLLANEGLNPEAVGRVRLQLSEGLVGQVAMREEPLNIENADLHPKFRFFAEIGEEHFHAFLGVPIIHHRKVLGVLVVQQRVSRRFDEGEVAFLVTVSAQLAGVVAHGLATGALDAISGADASQPATARFEGIGAANGVSIGTAYLIYPAADLEAVPDRTVDSIDAEIDAFRAAANAVRNDVKVVAKKAATLLQPEEQALFDVYLRMLDDSALAGEIQAVIEADSKSAQSALREVVMSHIRSFEAMDDAYLRERAGDIKDLGLRILAYLQQADHHQEPIPDHAVLVGEDIATSRLMEIPRENVAGIVCMKGATNSHMAIVARALGIPTVVGVSDLPWRRLSNRELIVDGHGGEVIANPSLAERSHYRSIIREEQELVAGFETVKDLEPETLDHHRVELWVNTGLMTDVTISLDRGAGGVGLYRTEIPFMARDRFPSEREQRDIYRQQLEAFAPNPVTMRSLDIGGDKSLPYFPISEDNPFLGWRGIRVTLDHPEIFLVQIRAMLWASEGLDNLRIMLPMISSVMEAEEALHLIHRAYMEVLEEGAKIEMPLVGVMIEVPAAVYQVRELAQRVDFLSVGSNDLTQYMLAVDRNNQRVANLYQAYHPAVLRALKRIVDQAHIEQKPVSICGESASDPALAVLLMAMGYDALSMSVSALLRVKWVIRHISMARAKELLEDVWEMDNAAVIRSYMDLALEREGMGRLTRPMR